MNSDTQEEIARSILIKEKRKSRANDLLNRRASAFPILVVMMLALGTGLFFDRADSFDAPLWVRVLLAISVAVSAANTVELWDTRRRLDATIFLLQQQNSKG